MIKNNFDAFPEELKEYQRFVCWIYEPSLKNPEILKKPPICPANGDKASVTDPDTWSSFEDAIKHYKKYRLPGIGLVLTEEMGLTVIDIDDCRDPKTGEINKFARSIMKKFRSYTEVSPSGTGIHIFIYGNIPGKGINKREIEVYDRQHYMTVTGKHVKGTPLEIKRYHSKLQKWYETLTEEDPRKATGVNSAKIDALSEVEILAKLMQVDSKGVFLKLLSGDVSGYRSHSEADLAFCSYLSGVTSSADTIDKMFRSSKLMRPKWDEKHGKRTYGQITITKALKNPHATIGNRLTENAAEYEIAKAVLKRIGRRNIFCLAKQNWLWSNSLGVWRVVQEEVIKKRIHKTAHMKSITHSRVNSVFSLMITEVYDNISRFNKCDKHVINCRNGELHLQEDAWLLKPHQRESYFCHQIPVVFDPDAECPQFLQYLNQVFAPDDDKREKKRLVQEFLGYVLVTSCEYERFLLLVGGGSNGKSVLLKVIEAMAGETNVSSVQPNKFETLYELAHLHGKLLNIVTEIPVGAVIADAMLKSITSGELIHAAHKYGHPFDFKPYSTLIFSANHLPHTKDCSPAFFRRAEVLTFNREFKEEERDTALADKLIEELPGILNFALRGLKRLFRRGDFTKVLSSNAAKREWELVADQVAAFIEEECELTPTARIPIKELYAKYTEWAFESGIKTNVSKTNLTSRLMRMSCKRIRTNGVRMLAGVKLRDE